MLPEISVVITTQKPAAGLSKLLQALVRQSVPAAHYEVILVADGCVSQVARIIASLSLPYSLHVVEQNKGHIYAARNRGAEEARAPILLFLDENIIAAPDLLERHLKAQAAHPGRVTLGIRLPDPPEKLAKKPLVAGYLPWRNYLRAEAGTQPRYTFQHFCAANFALPKAVFNQVGGFGFEPLAGCLPAEELDLAIRLIQAGTRFQHLPNPDVRTTRHDARTARQKAQAELLLLRKYPELFYQFKLAYQGRGLLRGRLWSWGWERPLSVRFWLGLIYLFWFVARLLKIERAETKLGGAISDYYYWQKICEELGDQAGWQRLITQARRSVPKENADLDLALNWANLAESLPQNPALGLTLRYGRRIVGYVPAQAGAARLEPAQVYAALSEKSDPELLRMLAGRYSELRRWLPPGQLLPTPSEIAEYSWPEPGPTHQRLPLITGRSPKTLIIEYDLLKPFEFEAGQNLAGYGQVWVLVRRGRQPLGVAEIELNTTVPDLELTPPLVWKALQDQLQLTPPPSGLAELPFTTPRPPISVVICTRNRSLILRRCLDALAKLDYPEYEIIVVDNAPTDDQTARLVAATPFRYVREDRPGLSNARNRGLREARYDLIAFTDDDVKVDRDWLHGLAEGFSDPAVMLVTGLTLPMELETVAQSWAEAYGAMFRGFRSKRFVAGRLQNRFGLIQSSDLGAGANMAFRRRVFELIGDFDTGLGTGSPATGGEDLEIFQRVLVQGMTAQYQPTALVWHQHRRDMAALRRQSFSFGAGTGVYLITAWRRNPGLRWAIVGWTLWHWLWHWGGGRIRAQLSGSYDYPLSLILQELLGAFYAPLAYLRGRQQARPIQLLPPRPPQPETYIRLGQEEVDEVLIVNRGLAPFGGKS